MMVGNARECIDTLLAYVSSPETLFELKARRKRRSTTQNAYYWAMLNKLARTLNVSDSTVHREMLKNYGVREVVYLRTDVPEEDFFTYCEVTGKGKIKGQEFKTVHVFKRSSKMNSEEFSHLIDGMRQECEQQGIPFATPQEIATMQFVEPKEE